MRPDPDVELQDTDFDQLRQIAAARGGVLQDGDLTDKAARTRLWQRGYVWRDAKGGNTATPEGLAALGRHAAGKIGSGG